jgi:hypothetical protein
MTTPPNRNPARSRAAAKKTASDKRKLEEAARAETADEQQEIGPAVVVYRDAEGNAQVALMNGIDPLTAPTLLQLGYKAINEQLGL